jgi:NADH-quinone oxidoreductase subunit E
VNELLNKHSLEIQRIKEKFPADEPGAAVMPLLHLAQSERGYITRQSIEDICDLTGVSITDIEAVIGFYTLFHEEGGRYRIQVCTDLPCMLRGADKFLKDMCANIGIRLGETTPDGLFTVEAVTCLAGCDHAPVLQVQGDGKMVYHQDMTLEAAAELVDTLRTRAGMPEGAG